MLKTIWLLHLGATITMFGVIWMVQIVHYPLFGQVGEAQFITYEARHQRLITWIVFPAMTVELLTAGWLVFERPDVFPAWALWSGFVLVGITWLSTAFIQVPLHTALSEGFVAEVHHRLVQTNWIRTLAWSLRCGLVLWLTGHVIDRF